MKKLLLFICFTSFVNINAQQQIASDINKGTNGSSLSYFFEFKNNLFFSAQIGEPFSSSEVKKLWKTDGTESGTNQIENLPDKGYFKTDNYIYYVTYNEIWKSDGTENGTSIIAENITYLVPLGAFKDYFYYLAYVDTNRNIGIFKTDGANTTVIKTFDADTYATNNIGNNGNAIFKFDENRFIAYIYTKNIGREPYISDGTEAGTFLLKDLTIGSNHSSTSNFYKANNKFFFINNASQLWVTDGTEVGTVFLKSFSGSAVTPIILGLTSFNNKVYFGSRHEFWESDGTNEGTKLVFSNINNDGGINVVVNRGSDLLLILERGIHIFDGNSTTTTKIATPDITYTRHYSASTNTKTYFIANYKGDGDRIWTTNGTVTGTTSIEPIWPDGATPTYEMHTIDENLIFTSGSHLGEYNIGELWVSDGTNSGTKLLKDINLAGNISSYPKFQTVLNGKLYFAADDNIHGRELFVFDGTNTTLVKDINPGFQSSNPFDFYVVNNKIMFKAYTLDKGYELWITDGTEAGTHIVKDINPNKGDAFLNDNRAYVRINEFFVFNNELYFFANNDINGMEPWKSDGTEAGTVLLKDINPTGANSSFGYNLDIRPIFFPYKNELYFVASKSGWDANLGKSEIWKTNGTTAGTVLVTAINNIMKEGTFNNGSFFTFNNLLYFTGGGRYTNKTNLFKTDGTIEGTKVVEDLKSGSYNAYPLKDKIYYKKDAYNSLGMEIWSIDKDDNITLVKDFVEGTQGSSPRNFYIFNDYLYFSIRNKTYQPELWRLSDTTEPEQLFTKDTETGTYAISEFFDYIQNDDKLYVNIQHNGNSAFGLRMYQFKNSSPNATPVFNFGNYTVLGSNGNLPGNFKSVSAFYNDKLYYTDDIDNKGVELVVVDVNTLNTNNYLTQQNTENSFNIFPNPADKILNIHSIHNLKVKTIYNLLGKKILSVKSNTIDVSNLKSGIYILKIEDQLGNISSKKWIKK